MKYSIIGFSNRLEVVDDGVIITDNQGTSNFLKFEEIYKFNYKMPSRMSNGSISINENMIAFNSKMNDADLLLSASDRITKHIVLPTEEEIRKLEEEEQERKRQIERELVEREQQRMWEQKISILKEKAKKDAQLVRKPEGPIVEKKKAELKEKDVKTYYEYKVICIKDHWLSGEFDSIEMEFRLNALALEGWRVKGVFTNELGKNALGVAGVGVNATIDNTNIILEREVFL